MAVEKDAATATADAGPSPSPQQDPEACVTGPDGDASLAEKKVSAFKSLGWLDRFLALWIFLAMVVGIVLGNFVPDISGALEKGHFVGVSLPIGKCPSSFSSLRCKMPT